MTEKSKPPVGETLLASHIPADASDGIVVPPLACDSHMHVFGPPARFPGVPSSSYAPRAAPLAAWRMAAGAIGLQRLVIVQPSVYGTDNACTLEAVRDAGDAARGIAAIDDMTSEATLHELDAAGFRGVRLNPKAVGARDIDALRSLIMRTAARIAPLGWHVQLYAEPDQIATIADTIRTAPVPVVLDHMGGVRAGDEAKALRPVLDLLAAGRCWVKLSGAYRVSRQASPAKPKLGEIDPIDEDINNPDRVVLANVILNAFGKQKALTTVHTFHIAPHNVSPMQGGHAINPPRFHTASTHTATSPRSVRMRVLRQ